MSLSCFQSGDPAISMAQGKSCLVSSVCLFVSVIVARGGSRAVMFFYRRVKDLVLAFALERGGGGGGGNPCSIHQVYGFSSHILDGS